MQVVVLTKIKKESCKKEKKAVRRFWVSEPAAGRTIGYRYTSLRQDRQRKAEARGKRLRFSLSPAGINALCQQILEATRDKNGRKYKNM